MQERFDSQTKEQIIASVKLKEQLREREKAIMDLQRDLMIKIKSFMQLYWTMKLERDNSEAERAQHLQKIHDLQEHVQEKERQFLELQEHINILVPLYDVFNFCNKHPIIRVFRVLIRVISRLLCGERLELNKTLEKKEHEMERSSRKHRDSDGDRDKDSTKDYKHRTSKHADDHYRSKHDKHRDTDVDDRRRRGERERSEDGEDRVKRERSYDREGSKDREPREKSVDNRRHHNHKRKDRGGESDDEDRYYEARDKRSRVADERKERRRFEDKVAAAEDDRDREERKERRKFEDRVKKEDTDGGDKSQQGKLNGETMTTSMKIEPKDEPYGDSNANGGSRSKAFGTPHETPLASINPPSSKYRWDFYYRCWQEWRHLSRCLI
ncbi:hypothetical protein L2E82_43371 [Cichorium intybus]|uniref:Uncharacterized protein n=1 Tax=Cichorium intybus TaxID=13427 RepID=A0ACB8ZP13_CICIN|nr:hypothetical protein L2E82_43371 [Cichorium intybus]